MKRFLIASVAVIFAATSFATVAEAGRGGKKWRHGGKHHHGWNHRGWHGRHYGYRHGYRYGHHHGRWHGGYWGPAIVFAPGYYGGNEVYYYDDEPVRESGR